MTAVALVSGAAWAQDAGRKAPPKMDLGLDLPSFGAIPKTTELTKPKADDTLQGPAATPTGSVYTLVRVQHAKAFLRTPTGAVPSGAALQTIGLSGKPLSTEKFTTVLRVKCPQRTGASIALTLFDPRGEVFMSSSGELSFRGTKGDEIDYTVDWDPTPCRASGDYQLQVQIAGQVLGTYPLKLAEPTK